MTTQKQTYRLYAAWCAADDAWQALLVKHFGKDACNRRYDASMKDWPQECVDAKAESLRLGAAYKGECAK